MKTRWKLASARFHVCLSKCLNVYISGVRIWKLKFARILYASKFFLKKHKTDQTGWLPKSLEILLSLELFQKIPGKKTGIPLLGHLHIFFKELRSNSSVESKSIGRPNKRLFSDYLFLGQYLTHSPGFFFFSLSELLTSRDDENWIWILFHSPVARDGVGNLAILQLQPHTAVTALYWSIVEEQPQPAT